jgi:competence protein ComEC
MPPPWVAFPLAGLVLTLVWLPPTRLWKPLAALLFGALWALLLAGALLWAPFPDDLARVPLVIEGRIGSIPTDTGLARRFLFRVERTLIDDGTREALRLAPFRGLVRLSWYGGPMDLSAGERWRLPVRLKPRHGFANPGGFDYERWLFEQGVKATGNLRKGPGLERLDPGPGPYWLTRWRQRFNEHLARVLAGSRSLPLVQALVTGTQSGFERADWEVMTRTGTSHLVAISGLNLGLVATVAFFLVRALWARRPRLALALAAPRAAAVGAFVAAFAYAALAGFSVSTRRALIMAAVVLAVLFWERTPRHWGALILALAGVLLLDPSAVVSYGFWLSFAAVAVLLFNLGQRLPRHDLWNRWGRAQWAVAVGLLPLLFLLFGRASVIAPLVNLVAEPLFTLVLFPLVLAASLLSLVPGLSLPLVLTAHLLDACLDLLAWVAAWPWAAAALPQGPPWVWPAAFAGVALLLAPRGLPGRWLGLPLLLPLLVARVPGPGSGEAWITLLDVGQGLAAVVRTRDGTLVFDTGPGYESGFNTGSLVVAPFLAAQGVGHMDLLVLSHADRDHTGGAVGLLERIPAGRILSGEPDALGIPGVEPCRVGEGWEWSGVRFRFLHPNRAGEKDNDASCVLRVEAGGRAILLPGDITQAVEARLVGEQSHMLRSDVLIAGHHGSATSTSAAFLDAVDPDLVLYSAGYANHFGFPAPEVRERVATRGIRALNTGVSGAIELRFGADGSIQGPWTWRERAGRLWTHRAPE